MINHIIHLLKITDSKKEIVQIAKGKYKIPMTWKEGLRKIKMKRNGN